MPLRVLLALLCLTPAIARADVAPDSDDTTMTDTDGDTDTTGSSVPPPEYTPCGCRADAPLAGSALLLGLLGLRRRRR